MLQIDGQTIWHRGDPTDASDIAASGCQFNQCHVRMPVRGWNRFADISLRDVSHWNCEISGAVLERVTLHNLKKIGSAPLFVSACLFKEVKLSGRISGLKINLHGATFPSTRTDAWNTATRRFYEEVDWAIDISDAKFSGGGVTFEALPGYLVRRNPQTQVLVRREAHQKTDWRAMDYQGTAIDYALSWFDQDSIFDSVVIAARSDAKNAQRDMAVLSMLRTAGIANQD